MATRFMHFMLSWEGVTGVNWQIDKTDLFLAGALLPDAVDFHQKKNTHFMSSRFSLKYSQSMFRERLAKVEPALALGWETHLDLDELWQRVCFRPRLVRVPLLLLCYGPQIGKTYYAEMSAFDVLYRDRLAPETIIQINNCLDRLGQYIPAKDTTISFQQWKDFLEKIRTDCNKKDVYMGLEFVGRKTFDRFCGLAQAKVLTNLQNSAF